MTSNHERASVLEQALRAGITGDRATLERALTEDVRAWTPTLSAAGRNELLEELERRDPAFSDHRVTIVPLDVGGSYACVEWTVEMVHTGRLELPDGPVLEPSGIAVTVHGITVAEFLDDRICALRQYWDEFSVLDQLVTDGAGDG